MVTAGNVAPVHGPTNIVPTIPAAKPALAAVIATTVAMSTLMSHPPKLKCAKLEKSGSPFCGVAPSYRAARLVPGLTNLFSAF
jgi:hypothetical protein